ncbi:hypothetical protein [Flavobacterium sp. XS2P14]|uniref:hypothetical protein n=1 Tax=unclassified Flavobacterium TaxID=196869 RepID=UPI003AAE2FC3
MRPLIDIHSSAIISILNLFIDFGELQNAKNYLKLVLGQIKCAKENLDFNPVANNSIENVIRFTVTGVKPVYFSDSTSPILMIIMKYLTLLDMEEEYVVMKEFILVNKIDLGLFVPYHCINSASNHLISAKENDLEVQLFSKSFRHRYQSETRLKKNFDKNLNFEEVKIKIVYKETEFEYNYRSYQAGYPFLKDLAHNYFKAPFFPDK